ncbi:MAG: acyl-CoA dehydrogenase family protein [Chitinophagales bacterium]|nr:acyl-CoA dehydrogenase family protein [Chitinophagales bacterium]
MEYLKKKKGSQQEAAEIFRLSNSGVEKIWRKYREGGNRIADFRIAIDQARLLILYAAWKLDTVGALAAMTEISSIKVVAPNVLQMITDEAIQMHGGAGLSYDFPLTAFFAMAHVIRIADGPDAVHRGLIARFELGKYSS